MRKIKMGMIGGGEGAFIGAIHRIAAAMDGQIELVCGALSSDPERALRSGKALHLPEDRIYSDYQDMIRCEAQLSEQERMDFVAIVTPNHLHFSAAQAALKSGFHVMSDKPATLNLAEALALRELIQSTDLLYGLTHTYTGYPLVKEARQRIAVNELGNVRKIVVEYPQGWLADLQENTENKQAQWRVDPSKAGVSCCMGDIGVHAANLAEYITGLKITELCADLTSFVDGRILDDDGSVLMRFNNGARGVLMASQISVGEENALRIRVYGEKGGLDWHQEEPNTLWLKWPDQPAQKLRTAAGYLGAMASENTRTPGGHPEGYLEAFANIYHNFAEQIQARLEQRDPPMKSLDIPGINEAVRGMAFIEKVVEASDSDQKWLPLDDY